MPIEDTSKFKNFREVPAAEPETFEQYPVGQWTPDGGEAIAFPVLRITETGGNRIVVQDRAYRDGAKLDDTGSVAISWSITALFERSLSESNHAEPDLSTVNAGAALYPDVLNALIDSFRIHETGDLVVPTRGIVRARLQGYVRNESFDQRDCAALDLTFIEDNEDNVGAQMFTAPSAAGSAGLLAEQTTFSEQSSGMWGGSIQDLNEMTSQIEGLANAPGEYAQDLEQMHKTVMNNVDRVIAAHTDAATEGRNTLSGAESTKVQRDLQMIKEVAGQSSQDARQGQKALVTKKYNSQMSIFQVATIENQDAQTLIENNPQIPDHLAIPKNTPVRMYADAAPTG
ncbi:MAG: DNA circularization N-terminal domain-containing protein [Planctomycetota bacterium]|nr:DNA circularization N-terminal domain-containing protein [Planctomycetota bacterium]